tara:strand:+ start:134 stop:487 length:354 start_codon:yes stop_codon:yes gene_type:complete
MTKKNYINNKEFEILIKAYKRDPDAHEKELFEKFDLLISNIVNSFNFRVDKEDAKQDCFVLILKTLKNFNPEQGSAFNYFTTIIVNNLKLIYTKKKKYSEKISKYQDIVNQRKPKLL